MNIWDKLFTKRSMLLQFFVSYLCIIAFMLTGSSMLHRQSLQVVKSEHNRANNAILNQFYNNLDGNLNSLALLSIQVNSSAQSELFTHQYSSGQKLTPYMRHRVRSLLASMNVVTETVENIMIYYSSDDYIVSFQSAVPSRTYYEAIYSKSIFTWDDFYTVINKPSQNGWIAFPSRYGGSTVAFVYTPFGSTNKVIISYNVVALSQYLNKSAWEGSGAFVAYNPQGEVLTSTNPAYSSIDIMPYVNTRGFFDMEHDGQQYVAKTIKSSTTGCYYASITPKEFAEEVVINTQRMEIMFLLVVVPAALLLSLILSQRNYSPLKRLLQWVDERTNEISRTTRRGNEIEALRNVLSSNFEERGQLLAQVRSGKTNLKLYYIREFLYGISEFGNELSDAFTQIGIRTLSEKVAVLLLNIESVNQEALSNDDQASFIIASVFEELAAQHHQGFVVALDTRRFACLVNFSQTGDPSEELLTIAQEGKQTLEENFRIPMTISLSTVHEGLPSIHTAFQEALEAMQYRLTLGANRIINYQAPLTEDVSYTYSTKTDQAIRYFIKAPKERSDIEGFVDELLQSRNIQQSSPLGVAQSFIYDVSGSLSKAINELPQGEERWKKSIVTRLVGCDTMTAFRMELVAVLCEYQSCFDEDSAKGSIGAQVRRYIDEHFHDPELNVNGLGDHFNLSAAYLSRIFKEENQIGILEYLSRSRLTYAKELLLNTTLSIQEIADRSGYMSSSVFIRSFKKAQGITPGAYRNLEGG